MQQLINKAITRQEPKAPDLGSMSDSEFAAFKRSRGMGYPRPLARIGYGGPDHRAVGKDADHPGRAMACSGLRSSAAAIPPDPKAIKTDA